MTKVEGSRSEQERQLEFRKKRLEYENKRFVEFTQTVKGFLEEGNPLQRDDIKKAQDTAGFLHYNDEQGYFIESSELYRLDQEIGITERLVEYWRTEHEEVYNIYRLIRGRAAWMRGTHGDMSNRVPLSIRREVVSAEIKFHRELMDFWNKRINKREKISAAEKLELLNLKEGIQSELHSYQVQANPYINADMTVAIYHSDEYEKIRREFLRVGGTKLYMVGEGTSLFARELLTHIHSDEFELLLREDPSAPLLAERNKFVTMSNDLDQDFVSKNPVADG